MPDPGCADGRCCFNVLNDEPGCWKMADVFGFDYDTDMDQPDHPECWSGIQRDLSIHLQIGCRSCDVGCDQFVDDFGSLMDGALWNNSRAYMRAIPLHRWGRNAKNQIFDLRADIPTLIHRLCALEHSSCIDNAGFGSPYQDGFSCWGYHVCQCFPGPPLDFANCGVPAGKPVNSIRPIHELFNHHGWPPGTHGSNPWNELFCRQFIPTEEESSPRDQSILVHPHGKNAVFLHGTPGMGYNLLVPCNGRVATSTCLHDGLDCATGIARLVGDPISARGNHAIQDTLYEEIWIDVPNVTMKMREKPSDSQAVVREKQLYADVIASVIGSTYPIENSPFNVTFDRMSMFLPSNQYVDEYVRSWDATWLPDVLSLPTLIEFPHSYARWGRVNIAATMKLMKATIKLKLNIPHFAQHNTGPPVDDDIHWFKRFAYFELDVETAMVITALETNVTVGGSPLIATQPPWLGLGGFGGLIPTVTPTGNRIVYSRELDAGGNPLPVRVPRKWRWVGRLGSFSDPIAESSTPRVQTDTAWTCSSLVDEIGIFDVPGLATANEEYPNDPNQNYDGVIPLHFVVQP